MNEPLAIHERRGSLQSTYKLIILDYRYHCGENSFQIKAVVADIAFINIIISQYAFFSSHQKEVLQYTRFLVISCFEPKIYIQYDNKKS